MTFHRCLRDEERAHSTRAPATLQTPSESPKTGSRNRDPVSPLPPVSPQFLMPQVCSCGKAGNPEEVVTVGIEL